MAKAKVMGTSEKLRAIYKIAAIIKAYELSYNRAHPEWMEKKFHPSIGGEIHTAEFPTRKCRDEDGCWHCSTKKFLERHMQLLEKSLARDT